MKSGGGGGGTSPMKSSNWPSKIILGPIIIMLITESQRIEIIRALNLRDGREKTTTLCIEMVDPF